MDTEIIGMEPEEIDGVLGILAAVYKCDVDEATRGLYHGIFAKYTKEEVSLAMDEYLEGDDAAFFPKNPGQITKFARKARNAKRLKYMPVVQEVVSEIRGSLNSYAPMPKYSHPLIDDLVRRLGYQRLCENTSAENQRLITFAAKEMIEHEIDSGSDQYTAEAERRAIAAEQKKLGNGGGGQIGAG